MRSNRMMPACSPHRLRRLLNPAVAVLAVACGLLVPATPADTQTTAAPGFTLLWSRSVEPLIDLAVSPQGGSISMITNTRKLTLWNADNGKSVWSITGITARKAVVSDQMGYVLAFDPMNRLDCKVAVYRSRTSTAASTSSAAAATPIPTAPLRVLKRALNGAIWAAGVSMDGSHAACGTGSRQVYLINLDLHPRISTHPIDGICNDLQFSGNNQYVALGLWNQSGVETMDMAGRIRWSFLGANDRRYDATISPDCRRVLAVSYINPNHADPVLTLLNDQGSALWSYSLGKSSYDASVRVSSSSQISYVSYTEAVRRGRDIVPERSLIALGPSGSLLWAKGGLFFHPTLLFVTPDGAGVIAYDGIGTLYRFDSEGQIVSRAKLSGQLNFWGVSRDRTRLVIYTSDGELSALRVK